MRGSSQDDALLSGLGVSFRTHLGVFVNYDDGQIECDEKPEEGTRKDHSAKEL